MHSVLWKVTMHRNWWSHTNTALKPCMQFLSRCSLFKIMQNKYSISCFLCAPDRKESTSTGPTKFEVQIVAQFDNHNSQVWRVSWNITSTLLASSGDDGCVRLWKGEGALNNCFLSSFYFSDSFSKSCLMWLFSEEYFTHSWHWSFPE